MSLRFATGSILPQVRKFVESDIAERRNTVDAIQFIDMTFAQTINGSNDAGGLVVGFAKGDQIFFVSTEQEVAGGGVCGENPECQLLQLHSQRRGSGSGGGDLALIILDQVSG